MIRTIRNILAWVLKGIGIFLLGYLLFSIIGGLIPVNQTFESKPSAYPVMLFTTGIHLDICIPLQSEVINWRTHFPDIPPEAANAQYISFGWGDRAFYLGVPVWDSVTFALGANALLKPTPSAMHVTWFDQPPSHMLGYHQVYVSAESYEVMVAHILKTLSQDEAQQCIRIEHEAFPELVDGFYEAEPRYQLFYTCNHWINEILRDGGVRTAWWTPFDRLILYHLD